MNVEGRSSDTSNVSSSPFRCCKLGDEFNDFLGELTYVEWQMLETHLARLDLREVEPRHR